MANRYGEAAIQTARAEAAYRSHPGERWAEMVARLYPTSETARRKGAPRRAFLALCESGLVRGIPAGAYTSSGGKDKGYAARAVELLREGAPATVSGLWAGVTEGEAMDHAGEMDVVVALWKNGLIVGSLVA